MGFGDGRGRAHSAMSNVDAAPEKDMTAIVRPRIPRGELVGLRDKLESIAASQARMDAKLDALGGNGQAGRVGRVEDRCANIEAQIMRLQWLAGGVTALMVVVDVAIRMVLR